MIDNIMNNIYGRSFGTNDNDKNIKKLSLNIDDYIKSYAELYSIKYEIRDNLCNTHIKVESLLRKGYGESEIIDKIKTSAKKLWEFIKKILTKCIEFIRKFIQRMTRNNLKNQIKKCTNILQKVKKYCKQIMTTASSEDTTLTRREFSRYNVIDNDKMTEYRNIKFPILILPTEKEKNDKFTIESSVYLDKYLEATLPHDVHLISEDDLIDKIKDLTGITIPKDLSIIQDINIIQEYNNSINKFDNDYIQNFDGNAMEKLYEISKIMLKTSNTYKSKKDLLAAWNKYIKDNNKDPLVIKIFEYLIKTIKVENTYAASTEATRKFIDVIKDPSNSNKLTFTVELSHSGAARLIYDLATIYENTYIQYMTSLNTNSEIMTNILVVLRKLQEALTKDIDKNISELQSSNLNDKDIERIITMVGDSIKTLQKMMYSIKGHVAITMKLATTLCNAMQEAITMFEEVKAGGK